MALAYCREDFFPPFFALVLVNAIAEIQDIRTGAWSSSHRRDNTERLRVFHETNTE